MTRAEKSTSCSGRPVDQSNSLRTVSSRQEVQTPLPPAHRKRTCCSLRSDTENVCCKDRQGIIREGWDRSLKMRHKLCGNLLCFLPQPSCHRCPPREPCSSIPPRGGHLLRGSSEWAAEGLFPEASQSETGGSSHLSITELITFWTQCVKLCGF